MDVVMVEFDDFQYKDRAEERRRKVGSTAISNPNKPAVQPVSYSSGPPTTESTIPGFVEPPSVVPTAAPGPSIGQMLLAKDGWLKKHQEEDSSVPLSGTVGFRRGGLGFDSRETQRSEIMKKTLDRLNKLLYVLKKQMKCQDHSYEATNSLIVFFLMSDGSEPI